MAEIKYPMSEIQFLLLLSLAAEMVIDNALWDFNIDQLRRDIDQALDEKNESKFMELTGRLQHVKQT